MLIFPATQSPPLATTNLFSLNVFHLPGGRGVGWGGFFYFLEFTYKREKNSLCVSLSDLFHLTYCPQGQSMLSRIARFHSFFTAEWYSMAFIYHNLFIYSSTSGHSGCFYVLVIGNNASVNMEVPISFWVNVFIFFNIHKYSCWII